MYQFNFLIGIQIIFTAVYFLNSIKYIFMENNWKYGDLILLKSNQKPYKFLSARSLIEKKVYFIEIKY